MGGFARSEARILRRGAGQPTGVRVALAREARGRDARCWVMWLAWMLATQVRTRSGGDGRLRIPEYVYGAGTALLAQMRDKSSLSQSATLRRSGTSVAAGATRWTPAVVGGELATTRCDEVQMLAMGATGLGGVDSVGSIETDPGTRSMRWPPIRTKRGAARSDRS
jgi:hypothetical protein